MKCESPRPQGGASRQGITIDIVPLDPAYLPAAGRQGGACGAPSGQGSKPARSDEPLVNQVQIKSKVQMIQTEEF